MEERDQRSSSENREKEQNKRLQRQIRDMKEEMGELAKKEAEASRKKHELVTMCDVCDSNYTAVISEQAVQLANPPILGELA